MYLIKFIPFHNTSRLIDWNKIEKLEVVKYDPIGDYGGWGTKSKKGKKAYNVAGDIGLKLYLKNGTYCSMRKEKIVIVMACLTHA